MHARELVHQVYRFAAGKGVEVDNPAEALARKAYATFVPRERHLSRHEIKAVLDALEHTGTMATLRLAVRFMLLTGVREGEFVGATWSEVDWDRAQWLIPADWMKAGKPHTVYLAVPVGIAGHRLDDATCSEPVDRTHRNPIDGG